MSFSFPMWKYCTWGMFSSSGSILFDQEEAESFGFELNNPVPSKWSSMEYTWDWWLFAGNLCHNHEHIWCSRRGTPFFLVEWCWDLWALVGHCHMTHCQVWRKEMRSSLESSCTASYFDFDVWMRCVWIAPKQTPPKLNTNVHTNSWNITTTTIIIIITKTTYHHHHNNNKSITP